MTEHDLPADQTPADLWAAYQRLTAENAALRAAQTEIEERTEKQLALLKQQIAQRKKAEDALQRESSIVRLLQEVAVAANEAHSIDAALQFALDKICQHMGWPLGHVYVQTRDGTGEMGSSGLWFCQDERFHPFRRTADSRRIVAGQEWLGRVLQSGQAQWQPDASLESWQLQASFALPVLVGSEVAAILEFFTIDRTPLEPDLVEVMEHIAIQLGRVVERIQAAEALRHSEDRFRAIFNQTFQFIGLLKPDGTLVEANQTALRFGGLKREEAVNRPFWEVRWWTIAPETQARLQEAIVEAANGRFVRYEVDVQGEGERVATIDFSLNPVWGDEDEVSWLIAEGRDITQLKEMMRRLRHSEAMLSDAQRVANLGSWEWDVATNQVYWSDEMHRIYGSNPKTEGISYEEFLARIHPDDLPHVEQTVTQAYVTCQPFEFFHRIIRADDAVRTLHGRGQPVLDETGKLVRMVGTGQDVTEQRETESRLMEAQQRARQTAELLRTANIALTQSLDLQTVLETLLDYLAALLPYDSGSIMLRRGASSLVVQAIRGYTVDFDAYPLRGRPLQITWFTHLEAVINRKESLKIDDTRTYPEWRPHFQFAGEVRSWLGVPLMANDQVVGLCSLNHKEADHFTNEYCLLAETLATQAAIAIQNARWFKELRDSQEQLRLLTERVVSVQEEERQRVSRELHDEAGQALTALKMSLDLIRADIPPTLTLAEQSLAEAIELTDETMERIRQLAHHLRPPALDMLGLNTALEGLCREFAGRTRLRATYEGCDLPRLTDAAAISLYRFVQEALTNVMKHANASQVEVVLRHEAGKLYLMVADDGQGFEVEETSSSDGTSRGLGLIGMMERLALLGGELKIESEPDKGTRLIAFTPLHLKEGVE